MGTRPVTVAFRQDRGDFCRTCTNVGGNPHRTRRSSTTPTWGSEPAASEAWGKTRLAPVPSIYLVSLSPHQEPNVPHEVPAVPQLALECGKPSSLWVQSCPMRCLPPLNTDHHSEHRRQAPPPACEGASTYCMESRHCKPNIILPSFEDFDPQPAPLLISGAPSRLPSSFLHSSYLFLVLLGKPAKGGEPGPTAGIRKSPLVNTPQNDAHAHRTTSFILPAQQTRCY